MNSWILHIPDDARQLTLNLIINSHILYRILSHIFIPVTARSLLVSNAARFLNETRLASGSRRQSFFRLCASAYKQFAYSIYLLGTSLIS